MDDMTPVPVVLPAHTLDDLLRMCDNVENGYGYQPVFVRVIRDRVAEAIERVKTLEAIAKDYGPDLVEHVLRRDQTLEHYMPQRPR